MDGVMECEVAMTRKRKGYQEADKEFVEVNASLSDDVVTINKCDESWSTGVRRSGSHLRIQLASGEWVRVEASFVPGGAWVSMGGETVFVEMLDRKPRGGAGSGQSGPVSPMPGVVVRVNVQSGDFVKEGDVLAVVEAMKMEHSVRAAADGEVTKVLVSAGDRVDGGALLAEVTDIGGGADDA